MLAEHYSPHHSTAMADLILWCLVDGESTSGAFSVKITAAESVDDLKKVIKAENPNQFSDVDAKDLTLWKVSLPIDTAVSALSLGSLPDGSTTEELLNARARVSGLFRGEQGQNDYIIVQRPPSGNATCCLMQAFQRALSSSTVVPVIDAYFSLDFFQ
jgi:hypothetical protein